MKWFTEPSGKFVIKIPTDWRYANVAAGHEEVSPFSFESYSNKNWAFQISCYSAEEKPLNKNVKPQKFDTPNLEFNEFRRDGGGFNMHIWGAVVEDHTIIAKYIYGTTKEKEKDILYELDRVKKALATVQLLCPENRTTAFELDKYEKFMASLAASFDLKYKAIENSSFIEFIIIVASQIDAYLRLSLLIKYQVEEQTNDLKIELLYQGESDPPIAERKIYKRSKEAGILSTEEFDELELLYKLRNKVVHRYIISDFRTRQIIELAIDYEKISEIIRLKLKELEDLSHERGFGIYSERYPRTEHPPEAINFLFSQVNDKHLVSDLERKIKSI
ncbi:hypothetical protein [Marinoscillum pacificum]|uniref:hypothetical protein n=1 Tax=Marinoscillum pacificum TaxID=392723 RepID=UPI0021586F19|nr:hypothetical protein [Marinoscillum pacificum]